ncbi:O-methyltransferase gedA [Psilocybe cubensis]|uniref:O-methyltransferase gedA n=1 Tax=Psilocybe cubensis TaxID=181762 RepID=A0ACB8HI03_PSICU|nr:O-methyltransferase gedA [Psilocybe cubensis]KAH9487380.1 O-methyltransferase gedA [Psilocybe cubensis]
MSPIDLVNDLQKLVVSTFSGEVTDPFEVYKAKHKISDLCLALLRSVQGPEEYTAILAESCQESSALNVITSLNVADHIAESPNGQLSLTELSKKVKADEQYLSVMLSSLAYHGYFVEVGGFGSQVYANNEFSNILLSETTHAKDGKSMKDAVGLAADDGAKSTTRLLEAATGKGKESSKTAANIAFGFDGSVFQWMSSPGNEWRGKRTAKAMVQLHGMANGEIGEDYSWEKLATPIIDIGGGIGSFEGVVLSAPKNRDLTFKIFDIEKTVEHAKKVWSGKPQWMQERVSFIAGDFMQSSPADSKIPTPAEGAGTYVIRHVLHDWNDDQVVTILTHVRNAMLGSPPPTTSTPPPRLLLVEMMLTETSSRFTRTTSLQLLSLSGGVTRTEVQFRKLIAQAGFIVENVTAVRGVDLIVELKPTPL